MGRPARLAAVQACRAKARTIAATVKAEAVMARSSWGRVVLSALVVRRFRFGLLLALFAVLVASSGGTARAVTVECGAGTGDLALTADLVGCPGDGLIVRGGPPWFDFTVPTPETMSATRGLVAAYGFEEGSGTTVVDSSGSGNDGSIVGATRTSAGVRVR